LGVETGDGASKSVEPSLPTPSTVACSPPAASAIDEASPLAAPSPSSSSPPPSLASPTAWALQPSVGSWLLLRSAPASARGAETGCREEKQGASKASEEKKAVGEGAGHAIEVHPPWCRAIGASPWKHLPSVGSWALPLPSPSPSLLPGGPRKSSFEGFGSAAAVGSGHEMELAEGKACKVVEDDAAVKLEEAAPS